MTLRSFVSCNLYVLCTYISILVGNIYSNSRLIIIYSPLHFEKWFVHIERACVCSYLYVIRASTNLSTNQWNSQHFGFFFRCCLSKQQSGARTYTSKRFRFQVAKYLGQGILFITQIVIMFMCIQ